MHLKGKFKLTEKQFENFQLGDEKVFQEIFKFYQPYLFDKVVRFCGNTSDAEEIVQEVFIQLFLKRNLLKDAQSLFPFLYTLSKRISISYFRKNLSHKKYCAFSALDWTEISNDTIHSIDYSHTSTILSEIVSSLPPQQRQVFELNKLEDRSYKQIAEELKISPNTVKNHLTEASKIVRYKLKKLIYYFL